MKRKRTFHGGLNVIVFFVFILGLSCNLYTDSYEATLEQHRKQTYGAWNAAVYNTTDQVIEEISNHAIVEQVGEMDICGSAVDAEGVGIGMVGYADDAVQSMGRLTLLDGHFPTEPDEIAVEEFCLTQIGYSYELGQTIQISLMYKDQNGAFCLAQHSFTLCGVVRNYSAQWKTDQSSVISFFVTDSFSNTYPSFSKNLFVELQQKYFESVTDLAYIVGHDGNFVINDYTYLAYSNQNEPASSRMIFQIIILLVGGLAIIVLINNELSRRQTSYTIMRILGASRLQIVQMFLKEKVPGLLVACVLGCAAGVLAPYWLFQLLKHMIAQGLYIAVVPQHFLRTSLFFFWGICLSCSIGLLRLFQIPLRGKPRQQAALQRIPKHPPPLTARTIFSAVNRGSLYKRLASTALVFISGAFLMISFWQVWYNYDSYRYYRNNYPEDYTFGLMATYSEPLQIAGQETLQQILNTYGVDSIDAFAVSKYLPIEFHGSVNLDYASQVHSFVASIVEELPDAENCAPMVAVSDGLLDDYLEIAGTEANTLAPNEIILYVPDYFVDADGTLYQADVDEQSSDTRLSETEIKVGDTISVTIHQQDRTLSIAGIIYGFDSDYPISQNPMRPFSMICTEETYEALFGTIDYCYFMVYGDKRAISYQTDVELSKINTALGFNCNRAVHSEQIQQLILLLAMSLILSVSGVLLTTIIRCGISESERAQEQQKYQLLYQLGMSRNCILKKLVLRSGLEAVVGTSLSVIALLLYRGMQEKAELLGYADYMKESVADLWRDIVLRCFNYTDWRFVMITALIALVINMVIMVVHDRKIARPVTDEQAR